MPEQGEPEFFEVDVGTQRVARVYAEALLNAAEKQNKAQEISEDLNALIGEVFRARPEIETFLYSAAVSREAKTATIKTAFQGRVSDLFTNFLLVLCEHDRLALLRSIRAEYQQELERRTNRLRVFVRSAVPLADDQRQRLTEGLRARYQKEPVLVATVDPALLGGLVVRVGDNLFDASVRARIETIRDQLIERSSHEIQSGRDRFSS